MTSMHIQRIPRNTVGRDFIVGDIHGAFDALHVHLDLIGFNPNTDRLIAAGDLVDRGPNSEDALDWISQPFFFSIQGNHESMCRSVFDGKLPPETHSWNGGDWFLALPREVQAVYVEAFAELPLAIELETNAGIIGVIHADCPFAEWHQLAEMLASDEAEDVADYCVWSRDRFEYGSTKPVGGVRAVVVGHHSLDQVRQLGNVICIDTGAAYDDGHFTILDAATLKPARIRGFAACA